MKTLVFLLTLAIASVAYSADLNLSWDPSTGATGYKVYMSTDQGTTWDAGIDVGLVTAYTYLAVPDSGLVLFRVESYNANGNALRSDAGAWYNGDWVPPTAPSGSGIE